jgi:hypothetical protein
LWLHLQLAYNIDARDFNKRAGTCQASAAVRENVARGVAVDKTGGSL